MFAGNFAPRGWAFCEGQLLAVSQNDALFSLFGTVYGGDGRTTFGIPDLRGRIPIHAGTGPGLSARRLGAKSGSEAVTLATNHLPVHTHEARGSGDAGNTPNPDGNVPAATGVDLYINQTPNTALAAPVSSSGGGAAHNNLMPYLCVHFIVALFGVYPSRT
jgi:microcystin-dependent protein